MIVTKIHHCGIAMHCDIADALADMDRSNTTRQLNNTLEFGRAAKLRRQPERATVAAGRGAYLAMVDINQAFKPSVVCFFTFQNLAYKSSMTWLALSSVLLWVLSSSVGGELLHCLVLDAQDSSGEQQQTMGVRRFKINLFRVLI